MSKKYNRNITNPLYEAAMGGKQRNALNLGDATQAIVNSMYTRVISELAINRFVWDGLPEGMNGRFLEMTLFYQGLCVFYYDPSYDRFLSLRATPMGNFNVYDNPTKFQTYANGTYTPRVLTARECVPIWCNTLRIPDTDIVQVFAQKLAIVDRTVDINLMQQRRPYVLTVPESQRLTAINAMKSVQDGDMAILATPQFDMNDVVQAFNTQVHPDLVTNTQLAKQKIWNECLTLLGINNSNQDKKERMVVTEVSANDEHVMNCRYSSLSARQVAAEQINRQYGLQVSVSYNSSPMTVDESFVSYETPKAVGDEDGRGAPGVPADELGK